MANICFGETSNLWPRFYGFNIFSVVPLVTGLFQGLMGEWQTGRQLDKAAWDWGRSLSLSNPECFYLETPLPIKNRGCWKWRCVSILLGHLCWASFLPDWKLCVQWGWNKPIDPALLVWLGIILYNFMQRCSCRLSNSIYRQCVLWNLDISAKIEFCHDRAFCLLNHKMQTAPGTYSKD